MFNPHKFLKSFTHATNGILFTLKEHQNLQFDVLAALVTLFVAFYFQIERWELVTVLTAIFFVFFAEMMNTAVEETCNAVTLDHHPKIKVAKDVAAGAVFMTSIFAVIVGIIIFLPYFLRLL
jgi:diacylglycerol kinase